MLKLLAEMPRHGYELIRAFREKGWGAGAGSVYPILGALEAAGLIVGRDEGDRRTYEISDKGRRLLEEHAKELGRLFDEDDEDEGCVRGRGGRSARGRGPAHAVDCATRIQRRNAETIGRVCELLDETRKRIYEVLAQE